MENSLSILWWKEESYWRKVENLYCEFKYIAELLLLENSTLKHCLVRVFTSSGVAAGPHFDWCHFFLNNMYSVFVVYVRSCVCVNFVSVLYFLPYPPCFGSCNKFYCIFIIINFTKNTHEKHIVLITRSTTIYVDYTKLANYVLVCVKHLITLRVDIGLD